MININTNECPPDVEDNDQIFKEMKRKHKKLTFKTPLHIACKKGFIELVKFLLSIDEINVNSLSYARTNFHFTPLHFAVKKNHKEIVKLLFTSSQINVNIEGIEMNMEFAKYSVFF